MHFDAEMLTATLMDLRQLGKLLRLWGEVGEVFADICSILIYGREAQCSYMLSETRDDYAKNYFVMQMEIMKMIIKKMIIMQKAVH